MTELQDEVKSVLEALKTGVAGFNEKFVALQKQTDAIDCKIQGAGFAGVGSGTGSADLAAAIWKTGRLEEFGKGARRVTIQLDRSLSEFSLQTKTAITSTAVGSSVSGVLPIRRYPGIIPEARRPLTLYDLLTKYPITMTSLDYVKVNSFSKVVSPQTEASAKGESEMLFTTATANVRTLATVIPASRQVIEDLSGLRSFIEGSLAFAVDEEVEDQLLSGSGTGQNLNGLLTQAQPFNTGLTTASDGWEKVDLIARAAQQIAQDNEVPPNLVVLNHADWWDIRLQKTTTGEYVFGAPDGPAPFNLFGLIAVPTNGMSAGYFLVGSTLPSCAAIFERGPLTVDISQEHSDFFVKNMVMFRAEQRLTLAVFRPNAYVYGQLNTSPA